MKIDGEYVVIFVDNMGGYFDSINFTTNPEDLKRILFKNYDFIIENGRKGSIKEVEQEIEKVKSLHDISLEDLKIEENENSSENPEKIEQETEKVVTDNTEEQQEEIKLEDMTPEQLKEIISKNQKTIESNEETLKQELIQKILEQQKIIGNQQNEIDNLLTAKRNNVVK